MAIDIFHAVEQNMWPVLKTTLSLFWGLMAFISETQF
ncbi:hypothetical protein C7972_103135 [Arenibacter sp. ARW7G5Y1]|nr:hypothetical protein C7972_103135 [Arenibacter sp. ARW7G5Y1]